MEDQRETDIQQLVIGVLYSSPRSTGDYGMGACCPFCYEDCSWNDEYAKDISHTPDCIVLIAKDLRTNMGNS